MTIEVVMRRPQSSEYNSVRALIETVANETFTDLFAPNPVPLSSKMRIGRWHGWQFLMKRLWA